MSQAYLIIANAPDFEEAQVRALSEGRKMVALDGAIDRLANLKIRPDILLGDFDSIVDPKKWGVTHVSTPYFNEQGIFVVSTPDQNFTDLEKAIDFCDAEGATSIDICAALGGRFDHSISNFGLLKRKHNKNRPLILHAPLQEIIFLKDEKYILHGCARDVVGLFGFIEASVSTQGLKYELNNAHLKFAEKESVANSMLSDQVMLTVEGELLLVKARRDS